MLRQENSNIEAIAVGSKDAGPLRDVKDFCVTAYVKEKLTDQQMKARGIEPFFNVARQSMSSRSAAELQEALDIDVVECRSAFRSLPGLSTPAAQRGRFGGNPPALNAQKEFRSLRCGIGVTNPTGSYPDSLSVGTAGFYMRDEEGNQYLVSNNHVIGKSNDAVPGESVVQPGTLDLTGTELQLMPDLGTLRQVLEVARVSAVVDLQFATASGTPNNRVDAAIAQLTNSPRERNDLDRLTFGGSIQGTARLRIDASGNLLPSSRVYKVGRTTGFTEGEVIGIAGVANIEYPGGVAHFVDQIVVRPTADNVGPFSDSGDSGSGVLNDQHDLVGLLYAGSTFQTLINPIDRVVQALRTATGIPSLEVITR